MKSIKKLIVILMVLFISLNQQTLSAKASNSFEINGVTVQYYDFTSAPQQCWAYANNIYTKIWGEGVSASISTNNLLSGLSVEEKRLTEDNLKEYISYAALGSAIRLTSYSGLYDAYDFVGHSQVIVQKDENGFTVLEGGMSCPGARREHYYTWAEYCRVWSSPNYHYIKYIVWPNAVSVSDIDTEKQEALVTHMDLMSEKEMRNEHIEKVMNLNEVSYPSSTAFACSVHGQMHQTSEEA